MASSSNQSGKVGSDPAAANQVGGKGDFGVREGDIGGRTYTSMNTKAADHGSAQARAGSDEDRVSGVGSNRSGRGSGSGGDVDADYNADGSMIGTVDDRTGADETSGNASSDAASGKPTSGNKPTTKQPGGRTIGVVDDESANPTGRGAASTNTAGRDDDSFAGEVSSGEASGDDN